MAIDAGQQISETKSRFTHKGPALCFLFAGKTKPHKSMKITATIQSAPGSIGYNRALALADAMADALNSLGEPFPFVRECVRAGQHPQELVDSMRPLLADILPCEYLESYQACALWASTDDEGEPLDDSGMGLAPETLDWFLADCGAFLGEVDGLGLPWRDEMEWSQLGHDLWLTRNGHGAGFWDRDLGDLGDALTEAAKRQGSADLYVGDDGLIYQ